MAVEVERYSGLHLEGRANRISSDWVQDESNGGVKYDSRAFDLRT